MNTAQINEFFESHPGVDVFYDALGVPFLDEEKAKRYCGGTGVKPVTHEREAAPEIEDFETGIAGEEEEELFDHTITEQDLVNNPELAEQGVAPGEVIQIPVKEDAPEPSPEVVQPIPGAVTYGDDEEIKERSAEKQKEANAKKKAAAEAKKKAETIKAKTAPKK